MQVYSAFVTNKKGRPPVHKLCEGFVERDRGLVLAVLEKFGERL